MPNEPAVTLAAELHSLKPWVSSWHYALLDGVRCEPGAGKWSTWGVGDADEQCMVAQNVWEQSVGQGSIKTFQCRVDAPPGWCLGAYSQSGYIVLPGPAVARQPVDKEWIGGNSAYLNGVYILIRCSC
eukprot:SAG31_NODE_5378_length_2576_cov_1.025434_1_plen_128_part_00